MPYLLDTHTLLWWWLDQPPLSAAARTLLMGHDDPIYVSPVSAIEIGIRVRHGKLPAMREPLERYDDLIRRSRFRHLPIDYIHARHAGLMPGEHRDPFDRLLAAQALIEGLTVITRDDAFAGFGCRVLW